MSKFVPRYDFSIVLYAESLGWDHRSVLAGDIGSHEEAVRHIQSRFGISFEAAADRYRQFLSEEIELFLTQKLGPRSE